MSENKLNIKLTQKEKKILEILWEKEPLRASDIAKFEDEELNINTVQAALKSLLKKELIKVADVIYSGTVLSRCYSPSMSRADFIKVEMSNYFKSVEKHISSIGIINTFLDSSEIDIELLDKFEQIINERKKDLN